MQRPLFAAFALAVTLVFSSATPASAQEAPKAEVAATYSYMYDDLGGTHRNLNGWDVSAAWHANDWFAVVGTVSGHYGDHEHHSLMGGPRFSYRSGRVTSFVQALAGGDATSGAGAFTLAAGVGVDVKLNDRISLRVVQADYHPIFYGSPANNFRVSSGIVFTFGR
jgi:hypothetical protein